MKIHKLVFPVDILVEQIEKATIKANQRELNNFAKSINTTFENDIKKIDFHLLLPLNLLHVGVKLAVLTVLNGKHAFIYKEMDD